MTNRKHCCPWVLHTTVFPISTCRSTVPYSKGKWIPNTSKHVCFPRGEAWRAGVGPYSPQSFLLWTTGSSLSSVTESTCWIAATPRKLSSVSHPLTREPLQTAFLSWSHGMLNLTVTAVLYKMLEPSLAYSFNVQCLLIYSGVGYA